MLLMKYLILFLLFFSLKIVQGTGVSDISNGFIENKGQVMDQNGVAQPDVKFVFQQKDLAVILKENSFSYLQFRISENLFFSESCLSSENSFSETAVSVHRIDIRFIGANSNPLIIKENKLQHYFNYHNTSPAINNVSSFSKVTYKNLYNNIDLIFCTNNGTIKYDFILHPGAELKNIQMVYDGADNAQLLLDGSIHIKTRDGALNEKIPMSYLLNDLKKVRVQYQVKNNVVSFKSTAYDKTQTLVVDPYPTIAWNTIFEHVNYYFSTSIDTHNNKVLSALCFSTNVATTGAHQTTLQGKTDAVVAKFDPDGQLLWATYYGGQNMESPYSVCSDNSDNIILTGRTNSQTNISTPGSFKPISAQPAAAFLAKFNANGVLVWATYYGGNTGDTPYSVCTDAADNILFVGQRSSTDFDFYTPGAFQQSPGLTYIAKFSSTGARLWGTQYGGPLTSAYKIICRDDDIFIAGETADRNLATASAHQHQPSGNYDAFLTKFSSAGNRIWSTYFGGEAKERMRYDDCLAVGADDAVLIFGTTSSANQIATTSAYKKTVSGTDAFIATFSDTGILNWSTYVGGEGDDIAQSIGVDEQNNIIISGNTTSNTGISTPCVFQPHIDLSNTNAPASQSNCFITKFDAAGNKIWGSYYSDNAATLNSIQIDRTNKIILTGFIRTSHTDTSIYGSIILYPFSGNAFITSFNEFTIPKASISITGKNPFCQGNSIVLTSTSGEKYLWSNGATTQSIVAIHEGNFFVTLSDANNCSSSSDTIHLSYIKPSITLSSAPKFCSGDKIDLTSTKGLYYKWSTLETSQSITITRPGNYFVTVMDTSNTCIATSDVLHIDEVTPPVIIFESKHDTICIGEEIEKGLQIPDAAFLWSTGSTDHTIKISTPGAYWIEVTKAPCPAVKDSFDITQIPGIFYKIPNLITPNNDAKNDCFELVNIIPNTHLSVYNSWGSLVYKDDQYTNNWAATDLVNGIYYYFISNPSICVNDYSGWLEIRR